MTDPSEGALPEIPGAQAAPPAAGVGGAQHVDVLPGKADSEGWRRLHPLSPLLRGGIFFIVLIGIIIANFRDRLVQFFITGDMGDPEEGGDIVSLIEWLSDGGLLFLALLVVLLVIALIVGLSWLAWRFHTYRITVETVESRSGVIFRQHRRAPLDRVQSVNLQRPLLARALGLTKIEVVTGGQGGKVDLSYLGHRDAKTVREQILRLAAARREGRAVDRPIDITRSEVAASFNGVPYAPAGDALTARAQDFVDFDVDPEAAASHSLVRVPVGRLLASIALSWEAFTVLILVIVAAGAGTISAIFGVASGSEAGVGIGTSVLLSVVPLILVFASIMFMQFNRGFNFTFSRGRDSIRVGSGLTSTTTDSIPFGRIHAIEARQPLLWRPFGWWRVRMTLAGHSVEQGGQSVTQNVVLPVGREDDVLRVIGVLLPGTVIGIPDGLAGPGEGYVRAGKRAGWVLWFGRRRAGIRIDVPGVDPLTGADGSPDEATLRIRRGFLTRSLAIMPIVRAQSVQFQRPMVHHWLGLATIRAHTVIGPVSLEMRGLALADARRIFDELAETVLHVQSAEAAERTARLATSSAASAPEGAADEPAPSASVQDAPREQGEL